MDESIFNLQGRMVDASGAGIGGLFLAIVDEDDLDEDDLLGLGKTREDGTFNLTFLGSEFRQDAFEMEATPDIKIVVSVLVDNVYKPIFIRGFANLGWGWGGGRVDLGDIMVHGYDPNTPRILEGVEALPGYEKTSSRLEIDDDMLRYCLAEVAPLVEKLTGWRNLLDGLEVAVADGTSSYSMRDSLVAQGIDPGSFNARLLTFFADHLLAPGMGCALYDPGTHTVVCNRSVMHQVGLDALKVIMGHELVHVGQYKHTPGLKAYVKATLIDLATRPQVDPDEARAKLRYNTELEGYARYIEEDFLRKDHYPMATLFYHASFTDRLLHGLVGLLSPDTNDATATKLAQYVDGLELYRKRQVGTTPVRFHFEVSSLPGGDAFV